MAKKHIVIDARIRRSSTGRYTDRLIEHLQDVDTENDYTVLLQPDDDWQARAGNFYTEVCPYPQFSFNPLDQIRFTRQLKRLNPDLVHFTMTQQPLLYFGNIVTTTHDLTMLRFIRPGTTPLPVFWLKKFLYRILFWWSHRKSDRIIVPTNYVADDLSDLQPFTTPVIRVTHEASEPPLPVRPEPLKAAKKPFILYVGTTFPHKNLDKLVKAFEILKEKQPKLQLILAGKREHYYMELEKKLENCPVKDSILLPGFVSDAELKWLYQNAEAYVFPSLSEGFGLPGLEAMMHGCPVVSSNYTCLPEVYGDAAVYFDPENAEDMAATINGLLRDESVQKQLVDSGYKQAKSYSWKRMAEQTLDIYKEIL